MLKMTFFLSRGGYSKPDIKDILWIQLILSPYYLVQYLIWFTRWVWRFWIRREEYGEEEKLYLIKKYLKASRSQWEVGVLCQQPWAVPSCMYTCNFKSQHLKIRCCTVILSLSFTKCTIPDHSKTMHIP